MSQERFNALYSNLQNISNYKNAINNALLSKGESTTGMNFDDYTHQLIRLVHCSENCTCFNRIANCNVDRCHCSV